MSLSLAAPAAVEDDQLQARTDYEALLGGEQTVDPPGTRLGLEAKRTALDSAGARPVCRRVTRLVDLQDRRWPERMHDVGFDVSLTN